MGTLELGLLEHWQLSQAIHRECRAIEETIEFDFYGDCELAAVVPLRSFELGGRVSFRNSEFDS